MVKIKICGIRRFDDALYLNKNMPDYAGFILSSGFRRSISFEDFLKLNDILDSRIKRVGVFVDEDIDSIRQFFPYLHAIQLHGSEDEGYIRLIRQISDMEIWKAVRAKDRVDIENCNKLSCDKLLIDSYVEGKIGGTGKTVDFRLVESAEIEKDFFLAGGLNQENVLEAIKITSPFGVDLSSSVETDGYKDEEKIARLIATIRGGFFDE